MFSEWENAYYWLNKILEYRKKDVSKFIQFQARLLKCIIATEYHEIDLTSHLQATYKYYKSNQIDNEITKQILNYFKKIDRAECNEKRIIIQKLNSYVKATLGKLALEKTPPPLDLDTLELWTRSKINNVTMAELIIREKEQKLC